jgi:hypothetical protein
MKPPPHPTADQIVDAIKVQLRPLAERGLKPEHIELSEQYAERLGPMFLRAPPGCGHLYERDGAVFGGVPLRLVQSPGVIRVVV